MTDNDLAAPRLAAGSDARTRFANDGIRVVLRLILDDLMHRLREQPGATAEVAPILRRLSSFCTAERSTGPRSLPALRETLAPERVESGARLLASHYLRLATR